MVIRPRPHPNRSGDSLLHWLCILALGVAIGWWVAVTDIVEVTSVWLTFVLD